MVTGLAFFTVGGLAAAMFFLAYHMITKTNIFLVAGWVHRQNGTLEIKELGGILKQSPVWAAIFFVSAFSLAGMPPLSGFAAKFLIIKSGVESGNVIVALVALFVGLFTLFSMVKIWIEVFWKPAPAGTVARELTLQPDKLMMGSSIFLAILIVAMGIFAAPVIEYCNGAAADLLDPEKYYSFILGIPNP